MIGFKGEEMAQNEKEESLCLGRPFFVSSLLVDRLAAPQ
jgi:hypothetical protein